MFCYVVSILQFHEEYWGSVSKDAKDLISSMLTVDPRKRISAKQALSNSWITGSDAKLAAMDLGKNLEEFKKFNAKRKFKAAVKGVTAANMMKKFVGGAKGTSLERKLTEDDIADLKETFAMFDKDGGGSISQSELKSVLDRLGMKVSDDEVMDVIKSVDENFDGEIQFDEGEELFRVFCCEFYMLCLTLTHRYLSIWSVSAIAVSVALRVVDAQDFVSSYDSRPSWYWKWRQ